MFPRIPALWNATSKLVQPDLPALEIVPLAELAGELKLSDAHGMLIDASFVRQTYSPQGYWISLPNLSAIRTAVRNIRSGPSLTDAVRRPGWCG
jgi:hypothetical protein